jgi:nucleotide-binding universal stress UspA family protein
MYKKILATVNEHFNSEIAAGYALNLAKACNSKLYLCFIAEKGISQHDTSKAENAVKRLFNDANAAGITTEAITETGDAVEEIAKIVRYKGIDIVFAATREEKAQKKFHAGAVTRRLLSKLPCSVAIVKVVHTGKIHPHRILVPLKAKILHIKEKACFTAKMAEGFNSKVLIFHVTRPVTKFFHGEVHLTPAQWEDRLPEDIKDFMNHFRKHIVEFESKISPGAAAKNITIEAAAKRHDLIIIGASERNMLSSLLKGNTVGEMLQETPCNLIILKP